MAFYYPIATGTIRGLKRVWSLTISERFEVEQTTPPQSKSVQFRKQLKFQYSNPSGGDMTKGVMPSFTTIDFIDVNFAVYESMEARVQAGSVDRAYRIDCVGGELSWSGFAQLDQISRYEWSNKRLPVTSIQFACGLADLGDIAMPGFFFGVSIHAMVRNALAYELHEKDIEYRFAWYPTNREIGEPQTARVWPINAFLQTAPVDRIRNMSDQFFFRIWQGLDNRWHCEQVSMIGKQIASGNGVEYFAFVEYDPFRDETDEVVYIPGARRAVTVSPRFGSGDMIRFLDRAAGTVRFGSEYSVYTYYWLQLARDGWFRYWLDPSTPYLWQVSGTVVQDARPVVDVWAASIQGASSWLMQQFQVVGAGEDVSLEWNFWACIEGVAVNNFDFEIGVIPVNAGDVQYYLTSAGIWTTTPTLLNSGNIGFSPGPTLTYTQLFIRNVDPIPVTGYPYIKFYGLGGGDNVVIDDVWIFPVDDSGNPQAELDFEALFITPYSGALGSREIKIDRDYFQSETRGTAFPSGYVNFAPTVEVYHVTPATVMSVDGWEDIADPGPVYYDLAHIAAVRGWFQQLQFAPRRWRGKIDAIAPPEYAVIIGGVECVALNVTVDGITDQTEGEWIENIRASEDLS